MIFKMNVSWRRVATMVAITLLAFAAARAFFSVLDQIKANGEKAQIDWAASNVRKLRETAFDPIMTGQPFKAGGCTLQAYVSNAKTEADWLPSSMFFIADCPTVVVISESNNRFKSNAATAATIMPKVGQ